MVNQGKYMIGNHAIERDVVLTEALKLKRVEAFDDLEPDKLRQYSLVQKDDLLPHKAERLIGNKTKCFVRNTSLTCF